MRHFRESCATVAAIVGTVMMAGLARADVPAFTMSGFTNVASATNQTHYSVGYTFQLEQATTITALGMLDIGGNKIQMQAPEPVFIYWSSPGLTVAVGGMYPPGPTGNRVGNIELSANVLSSDPILSLSGGSYTSGDGFRYHMLDTPLQLPAGFYVISGATLGTGFDSQANDYASASGVDGQTSSGSQFRGTFDSTFPDDTANFPNTASTATAPGGFFGPNFLIATPEPGSIAVVILSGGIVLRRRR